MDYPKAPAVLKRYQGRRREPNLWIVPECPLCGQRHVHGAGWPESDPRAFLGHRGAHCADPAVRGNGYVLAEAT